MPNWCKGTLRVKGKQKDIKRFVLEGLKPVDYFGNEKEPLRIHNSHVFSSDSCWIEGTKRGFIEDLDVYFDDEDEETICIGVESIFAQVIDAEQLAELSKRYEVNFRIYGFESGAKFNQDVEIVDGAVVKNEEIMFNDYVWDCICPNEGG